MKNCSYVFKKGQKKGLLCDMICKDSDIMCIKHKLKETNPQDSKVKIPSIVNNKKDTNKNEDKIKNQIISLPTSNDNKRIIMKHYLNMKRADSNSTEYYKNQVFVDFSLSYPWDKSYNIQSRIHDMNIKNFILSIQTEFDKHIHGMHNVKNEIINIICKFISNPDNNRNNIALYGNAGVAKTKFIKILSDILNIPMKIISLGGIKDSSFFLGHGYVYVESSPGKIIQNLIDSQVNNPIIYFDELDKVSQTDSGKDVLSFLTFLTDHTQNHQFTDHYFYGMKFDLSKVFYVFSFNDVNKIDKVLLDRLNLIYVETPNNEDISTILIKYCLPEIIKNIGIKQKIIIDKECIFKIINFCEKFIDKSVSSGIREYYRFIEKMLLELNKNILLGNITTHNTNNVIIIDDELFICYFDLVKNTYYQLDTLPISLLHMYI